MKRMILIICIMLSTLVSHTTIHVVHVWEGYYQFKNPANPFVVELGDTIQWLPFDFPAMVHTITSTDIPEGAEPFDQIWQAPADTFFQYVPAVIGVYDYECTPHVDMNMVSSFTVVEGSTSSGDVLTEANVQVYPNPTSDYLHIDFSSIKGMELNLQVFDHSGRQISALTQGAVTDSDSRITTPLHRLKPGLYYLLIETEGRMLTKKFIKN